MSVDRREAGAVVRRRTPDGTAYQVQAGWGNTGSVLQAVCSNAIDLKTGVKRFTEQEVNDALCFIDREIGYLFNHKCDRSNDTCATPDEEGFSYMIGCASSTFDTCPCPVQP